MLCPQSSALTTFHPGLAPFPRSLETASPEAVLRPQHSPGTRVSLQEHPGLLRLLGNERFRAELKAHLVEALARHGIHLDLADVPAQVRLPEIDVEYACAGMLPWAALFA